MGVGKEGWGGGGINTASNNQCLALAIWFRKHWLSKPDLEKNTTNHFDNLKMRWLEAKLQLLTSHFLQSGTYTTPSIYFFMHFLLPMTS